MSFRSDRIFLAKKKRFARSANCCPGLSAPRMREDDIEGLIELIPVERVTAGSDFPHYDALAEPTDFAKHLDGLSSQDVRKVMRDNLRSMLTPQ